MDEHTTEKDLMSLLVEKQREIRRKCQKYWNEEQNISIAESEWMMLRHIKEDHMAASDLAKRLGVSRQASHKIVKGMEEKGLVTVNEKKEYKGRRCVHLTAQGDDYYRQYQKMKKHLLKEIEERIGSENTEQLKAILSIDWGLGE